MDGIPALDLWWLVIEVFHSSTNQSNKTKDVRELWRTLSANTQPKMQKQVPTTHTNIDLTNIHHVPSNPNTFWFQCYVACLRGQWSRDWDGNQRQQSNNVTRTHRGALDWLFDRINLDPKIQIRYIDTKHQLADILTKGIFTRDEWNNLVHLFTISFFSSLCCAQNFSLTSRWRRGYKNEKKKTGLWQNQSRRRWTWLQLSRQVPHPWTIRLRQKARLHSKHPPGNLRARRKFKTWRSVEFLRKAERCILWRVDGQSSGETWRDRQKSGIMGVFWIWIMKQPRGLSDKETCCVRKFRTFREF